MSVPSVSARIASSAKPAQVELLTSVQLSQTLSHFSLTHSSPPYVNMQSSHCVTGPHATPSTSGPDHQLPASSVTSTTPRRPPAMTETPHLKPLSRERAVYPFTAPLPQLPRFLGSPFSTNSARGRYMYGSASPSKGFMTERIGQNDFHQPGLEWPGQSEWIADEVEDRQTEEQSDLEIENEDVSAALPQPSSRSRRDTSGSTSSQDDFSGSGTSSASLLSLGRNSSEYHSRPSFVTIWGEEREGFHDDDAPATPIRQLFASIEEAEDALQMSAKTARQSPGLSPLISKTASPKSPQDRVRLYSLSFSPTVHPTRPPICIIHRLHQPSPLDRPCRASFLDSYRPRARTTKEVRDQQPRIRLIVLQYLQQRLRMS